MPLSYSDTAARVSIFLWPLFFATLWDFYWGGVRPMDIFAAAVLVGITIAQWRRTVEPNFLRHSAVAMLTIVAIALISVLVSDNAFKPVLGIFLGFFVFCMLRLGEIESVRIARLATFLLMVNLAAQWLQMLSWYVFDVALNFHGWLGFENRLQWVVYRAAGLYQEPAHFCLMIFSLLVLRAVHDDRRSWIELFALTSMLLSFSVWGLFGIAVYVFFFATRYVPALVAFVASAALLALSSMPLADFPLQQVFIDRLDSLITDQSAVSRYGVFFARGNTVFLDSAFWFGAGISNDYVENYGASSLAFLLHSIGALGVIAMVGALFFYLWRFGRLRAAIAAVFMLSATSLWTFVWWWSWLALVMQTRKVALEIPGSR
jgi:hypothetical protein